MKPLNFVIAGSGWRALFFVRIAQRYPELFHLNYMLCRSEEKAALIKKEHGIPVTTSKEVCEASAPDFVVVAVNRNVMYDMAKEWLLKGFPVLMETPAGLNVQQLEELWRLKEQKGVRLQVAEQYLRYPVMAAGLRAVKEGLLGEPYAVTLSVAHDYHGASLIRHMLGCGRDVRNTFPKMRFRAEQYTFPVMETDSRYGAITDGHMENRERTRVTIEFDCSSAPGTDEVFHVDKAAFYDFSGVQYHSFIRARHVNVQGSRGEWNDTVLRYADERNHPVQMPLKPYLKPEYRELNTQELLAMSDIWNPFLMLENVQDEYAIASMMLDMCAYLETGREIYPLAEALEDAYTWLLMQEAVRRPEQMISSAPQIWHTASEV